MANSYEEQTLCKIYNFPTTGVRYSNIQGRGEPVEFAGAKAPTNFKNIGVIVGNQKSIVNISNFVIIRDEMCKNYHFSRRVCL